MTRIRIKASDSHYQPPNVAYIYNSQPDNHWSCILANGIPASLSYAGVRRDEMGCRFALEECETADQALAVVLSFADRFLSGSQQGETVYSYELASS